jgi:hypothetical protein
MYDMNRVTSQGAAAEKVSPVDLMPRLEPPKRLEERPELARLLSEQEQQVQDLHNVISSLEVRLEPAMAPVGPGATGSGEAGLDTVIGNCVHANTRAVAHATARLVSILSRLGV